MRDSTVAEIIPFPLHRIEEVGRARLDSSLARVQAALLEQAEAIAAWRAQLTGLRQTAGSLGRSFAECNAHLGTALEGLEALGAEARRMEALGAEAALSPVPAR